MRTGGYGGPVGFLVKKYTCPVIFLGCPGRPGLVFVGPWHHGISEFSIYTLSDLGVLSNLIGSLSLANEHYSPPTE